MGPRLGKSRCMGPRLGKSRCMGHDRDLNHEVSGRDSDRDRDFTQPRQVSAGAWSPYDVKYIAFNGRDVNNVCIDESGTGIMDPRAGAVRAVTRGRVVSIKVPLVHTSRCNARGSGSTTRGARQIPVKSSNFRAAEIFFKNVWEKVVFGRRRTL